MISTEKAENAASFHLNTRRFVSKGPESVYTSLWGVNTHAASWNQLPAWRAHLGNSPPGLLFSHSVAHFCYLWNGESQLTNLNMVLMRKMGEYKTPVFCIKTAVFDIILLQEHQMLEEMRLQWWDSAMPFKEHIFSSFFLTDIWLCCSGHESEVGVLQIRMREKCCSSGAQAIYFSEKSS